MDIGALCGYTDESGTFVESETQVVCDNWADACVNNIPMIGFMCEAPWDAPTAVHEVFEQEDGWSLYAFCDSSRDYEDFNVDDFCAEGSDFADICVNGYPDFVKVCETEFPPGTFDGSNYEQICELDVEDVCSEVPELCGSDGSISSDLCGAYPELCDQNSSEYNQCAANLYDCMMDPNFDMCREFPFLCGFETDFESFEIPTFHPAENANVLIKGDTENYYTCRAVLWERFGVVSDVIDSLNYFYNANITAGAEYNATIEMGARKYETLEAETSTLIGDENYDVTANFYVPELSIFYDFDAAEEFFDEIFGADENDAHYDVMGEAWSHKEIETVNATGTFYDDAFSRVKVGYKLNNTEEEPIYIGFIFEAEMPQDKLVSGAEVIQWAKYTLYDNEGNATDVSYAVGCSSIIGDQNATTVKTYENTLDIESMDDDALADLEV